jgi:O-acetyl-ADP-ribose deacetylase (regulator of RNase III)
MFVVRAEQLLGPRHIINFPTKKHWRSPSRLSYIDEGLKDLIRVIRERNIKSVAIPPLGVGNGGLNWADVEPRIAAALAEIPEVHAIIYPPENGARG